MWRQAAKNASRAGWTVLIARHLCWVVTLGACLPAVPAWNLVYLFERRWAYAMWALIVLPLLTSAAMGQRFSPMRTGRGGVRAAMFVGPHAALCMFAGTAAGLFMETFGDPYPPNVVYRLGPSILSQCGILGQGLGFIAGITVMLRAAGEGDGALRCPWPLRCTHCGYALLAYQRGTHCPECGKPREDTVREVNASFVSLQRFAEASVYPGGPMVGRFMQGLLTGILAWTLAATVYGVLIVTGIVDRFDLSNMRRFLPDGPNTPWPGFVIGFALAGVWLVVVQSVAAHRTSAVDPTRGLVWFAISAGLWLVFRFFQICVSTTDGIESFLAAVGLGLTAYVFTQARGGANPDTVPRKPST